MKRLELVGGIIGLVYLMLFSLFTLEDSLIWATVLFILLLLLAKASFKKELGLANFLAAILLAVWLLIEQWEFIKLEDWFLKLTFTKFLPLANLTLFIYMFSIACFTSVTEKGASYYLQLGISYFISFHYTLLYLARVDKSFLYSILLVLMCIEIGGLIYSGINYILTGGDKIVC